MARRGAIVYREPLQKLDERDSPDFNLQSFPVRRSVRFFGPGDSWQIPALVDAIERKAQEEAQDWIRQHESSEPDWYLRRQLEELVEDEALLVEERRVTQEYGAQLHELYETRAKLLKLKEEALRCYLEKQLQECTQAAAMSNTEEEEEDEDEDECFDMWDDSQDVVADDVQSCCLVARLERLRMQGEELKRCLRHCVPLAPEAKSLEIERDAILEWLRRYRWHSKSFLWRDMLVSVERNKPARARPVREIVSAFSDSEEGTAVRSKFHEDCSRKQDDWKLRKTEFQKAIKFKLCHDLVELDDDFASRSVPGSLTCNGPVQCRDDGIQLALPLRHCLKWLGCPAACAFASLSPAAATEVAQLPKHCSSRCPAARRCEVCAFAVLPSMDQSTRFTMHCRSCAPWPVDGLILRTFLPAQQEALPAIFFRAAIRTASHMVERECFRRADAIVPGDDSITPVCCPLFGCDVVCAGRVDALRHASTCTQGIHPPFCTIELKHRLDARQKVPEDICNDVGRIECT